MKNRIWILLALIMTLAFVPLLAGEAEGKPDDDSFGLNTVYYNGKYYPTLKEALTAVYMSKPAGVAELYCKTGADVGPLTHGHVADDIIIYGNGARVSGGEYDMEIDTYMFDRNTGNQSETGSFLDKDITVKVYDLNGIAAWGQRNTNHTINLYFENCKNMNRIYFTNTANDKGRINVTLSGCSFDANQGSNANTSVYSNAPGDILISDTTFTDIAVGLNINHKSAGVQNITLENCTFTDCALSASTKTYGAPVRIVARLGATTNLTVEGAKFHYSAGNQNVGNGDVLIGDGRYDAPEKQGTVTLQMTDTEADVVVQKAMYYDEAGNVTDPQKAQTTVVSRSDMLIADTDNHFILDCHDQISLVGEKQATCIAEGYTGDRVCSVCGMVVEKGKSIPKTEHNFQNGVCTMCGMAQPSEPAAVPPRTGEGNQRTLWLALLLVSGACLAAAVLARRKGRHQA
ncbi:MAG TPA: hypothetical protein IAC11_01475 [Candidatus Limiplasma pullicola]|nr:hypothetical protein [Candidatus Limiplasma pullicola]